MLRLLLLLPFLVLLAAFALSNEETVQLRLWPTDFALDAPLSVAMLATAALFFFLGALIAWVGTLGARRRARRAERRVEALEAERARLVPEPAVPPAPGRALVTLAR